MASTERAPAGCPAEIWAEFSKAIDAYMVGWEKQLREHVQQIDDRQKFDAEWDEEKHPRDERGRWTDGGAGADGWIASLKEHPVFGNEALGGGFMQHAESLRPLANQVSFDGLKIGNPPATGTVDSERYRYFEKLNQLASNMERHPEEGKRLDLLVKAYGPDKVALALIADRHIIGQSAFDLRTAIEAVKTPEGRAQYLDLMKTLPNVNGTAPLERAVLAYAVENHLSSHELMDQLSGARAYSSVAYKEMNGAMREGREPDPAAARAIAAFDELLKHAPDVESHDTIYRGMRINRMRASGLVTALRTPGATFTEKGFVSASSSKGFVDSWIRGKAVEDDGDPSKLYYRLEWPHVGGAKNVTAFHALGMAEGELNYRRGQTFRVKEVTSPKWNHFHVKLEHVR